MTGSTRLGCCVRVLLHHLEARGILAATAAEVKLEEMKRQHEMTRRGRRRPRSSHSQANRILQVKLPKADPSPEFVSEFVDLSFHEGLMGAWKMAAAASTSIVAAPVINRPSRRKLLCLPVACEKSSQPWHEGTCSVKFPALGRVGLLEGSKCFIRELG